MSDFGWTQDADGVVTVTMDFEGQSANTMNARYLPGITAILDRVEAEKPAGVIFASAKKTFFAGGDLNDILSVETADQATLDYVEANKAPFRRMERMGVPFVAAIGGAALGGGYELCLACCRRVALNAPHVVTGLPEVTLGLLPAAGGVTRLPALIGLEKALPILLEGKPQRPEKALKLGMVDELVADPADLIPAAKAWIMANPGPHVRPWDQRGFTHPGGGAEDARVRQVITGASAMLFDRTRGLYPAPEKILDVAVNSLRMGFDAALRAESRAMVGLIASPQTKAMIRTWFFGMQALRSGAMRPEGPSWQATRAGVIGAGMMGGGIAGANAAKGLETALIDTDADRAAKGKAQAEGGTAKAVKRKRMDEATREAILSRITTGADDHLLDGADLIVEAVFEDVDLKEKVIARTFPRLAEGGVYASNTSTLPISVLAEAADDPSRFLGLHFFSPVDRMKIVEVIRGEKTSAETLAKGYDYVRQIGYTPIVVNDARGFFTSRVIGAYLDEAQALLRDGASAVSVERAAWAAGFPVGPLAVQDEVSLILSQKIRDTHVALDRRLGLNEPGYPAEGEASTEIGGAMIAAGRGGRHYGGGFYDYPADGPKRLWPGLADLAKGPGVDFEDAKDRLLWRFSAETVRCFDEGVLATPVEGDIGGVMAIGFPAWTGGPLQFVRLKGRDAWKARADALAEAWGPRFAVSDAALDKLTAAQGA